MTDCKYKNGEQCQKVIDYNKRFKTDFCDHCCDGCKHAIEMTCSIVCCITETEEKAKEYIDKQMEGNVYSGIGVYKVIPVEVYN